MEGGVQRAVGMDAMDGGDGGMENGNCGNILRHLRRCCCGWVLHTVCPHPSLTKTCGLQGALAHIQLRNPQTSLAHWSHCGCAVVSAWHEHTLACTATTCTIASRCPWCWEYTLMLPKLPGHKHFVEWLWCILVLACISQLLHPKKTMHKTVNVCFLAHQP